MRLGSPHHDARMKKSDDDWKADEQPPEPIERVPIDERQQHQRDNATDGHIDHDSQHTACQHARSSDATAACQLHLRDDGPDRAGGFAELTDEEHPSGWRNGKQTSRPRRTERHIGRVAKTAPAARTSERINDAIGSRCRPSPSSGDHAR